MFYLRILIIGVIVVLPSLCSSDQPIESAGLAIKPFETDGCSLFFDGTFSHKNAWKSCCVTHDKLYWAGGTSQQRHEADKALELCVQDHQGNDFVARIMYLGARMGGHPLIPAWFRWGYGWPYYRGYQALTVPEQSMIEAELLKVPD